MISYSNCLIDNWSLEAAGELLENKSDLESDTNFDFMEKIGCLSNVINGIIFYDGIKILDNGKQVYWKKYSNFSNKISKLLTEIKTENLSEYYTSYFSDNSAADYYLSLSMLNNCELLISPLRASKIKNSPMNKGQSSNATYELLKLVDNQIKENANGLWLEKPKIDILNNFMIPSVTHLVLSEAINKNDIINVAFDLKKSSQLKSLKNAVENAGNNFDDLIELQNHISALLDKMLKKTKTKDRPWTIGISILFLSIRYSVGLNFKSKHYLALLKDIIDHRKEMNSSAFHVKRLFGVDMKME